MGQEGEQPRTESLTDLLAGILSDAELARRLINPHDLGRASDSPMRSRKL